ncbi:MAG TPA: hypothetical protein VIJ75_21035 [Hanamia sp.]
MKIGATAVSSITSSTSTQIVAVVATACTGTVSVTTTGGTATSSATFTAYSYPTAPTVITPINYCLNAVASQLTATGSNLTWGSGSISGTAGGTTTLSTVAFIDGVYNYKNTNFTTTTSNVKITSINYYIPAYQAVTNLVLALYNSSGTIIATSSTSTTLNNSSSSVVTITNIFNYTIASAGNYSVGASTGYGNIGGDSTSFPITESSGTINVTGTTTPAGATTPYHCFNNIQFTVNNGGTAPTPSTSVAGTTNYLVSQTVNGCVSPQATIAVIVNTPPSATISYSGTPYCNSLGTAQNVTLTGTSGGTYSASPSGLSINSSTGAITPSTSTPGTYNVTYTIPASGGCAVYTTTTSLTVSALSVGGSVGSNATVCSGTNSGTLNLTGQTGSILNWQYSINGGTTWTSIANTTTSQTYSNLTQTTLYRAVVQSGVCSSANSSNATITVSAAPSATISYSGSPFCINSGTASVTSTGTTGGAYSSTAGLSINSATGVINLNSSTAGTYTVTYTIAAAGGCSIYTKTTSITVNPSVGIPVFALGSTSARCQGVGSVMYTATATNAGGISYSLDAASISGGNSINSSTGSVTYIAGWNGTSTITASASGCGGPATSTHTVTTGAPPSVSATTTYTCVGGTSGTITASGSGGSTPYTYSLNGGTYQSSNLFTGLAAGTYTLSIKSNSGCTASTPASVIVSPYPNSTDDQTATGTDTWIGHMYSGMNFQNYIGHFTEAESFDEGFGGDYNCFTVSSGATSPSIYTEQFSVRFRMNSAREGLYVADLGSDDGSRLYVNGTLIYNNWTDQSFSTRPSVLMNLTGSSSLVYEFYENSGANRVIFNNGKLILANNLSSNTNQSICKGSTGVAIGGDTFGTLPSGITLSGTGYQWTYSTTPTGTRTNISGATAATYSPNTSIAPFNVAGTYYIYRNAKLSSSNNTGVSPYVASNESNAATITVNPTVGTPVFALGSTSTRCQGAGSVTYNATATNSGSIAYNLDAMSISGGNSINSSTGAVTYSAGWNGTSTITASASGCSGPATSTHTVTTGTIPSVSATTTYTCVGGSSGTITASGSGGSTPYTYSLNGGYYQSSNLFTGLAAGTYTLSIKSNTGCTVSVPASITVSPYPNSTDDQTATGTDTWIGHMYSGMNFQNYIGHFTEAETFNEGFGGDQTCFSVTSGATTPSVFTDNFSVRFRMNSTRKGLYVVDLGSDDGSRLTVDGNLIYNNWSDQVFTTRPRVLMNLSGTSSLVYEFYENGGQNQVIFQNLTQVLANTLSSNTTQTICTGNTGSAISGDSFGTLPSGISLSGTGYQWTYSSTPTGTRSNISGATSATYSPNSSSAPFNVPGTYYIYRNAILSSTNNTGVSPYVATNESNAAIITVSPISVGGSVGSNSTVCSGTNSGTVNLTGQTGNVLKWQFSVDGTTWVDIANISTSQPFSNLTQTTLGRAVVQRGACASVNSNPVTITVNQVPSASISYSGSPFCSGGATGTVTQTGTTGGTYSSTSGVAINSVTGAIDLSSSTPGNYTVAYSIAAGACAAYSTTANVLITLPGSWIGTVSADWNDSRNWLCGQIPNSTIDATISAGASYYPDIISGVMPVRNININSGGDLTVAGGTLQIFGSIINAGTFDASNGSIEMHGTSSQTIPAGAFTNNNVKNLIISNSSAAGVTLAGNVDVYQSLTYSTGGTTLNTGGYLTLKSTATETAWVGNMTGHTIVGDVTVERYAASINNWQFLSVPTQTTQTIHQAWQENQAAGVAGTFGYGTNITGPTGGIGFDFISPNVSMNYWDNSAGAYKTIMNTGVQFPNKTNGFFIYIRGDRRATALATTPHQPTILRSKGPLYTGSVDFTVPAKSYYSLGNPYASKVDFSNVSGMSSIGSNFYVWDPLIYGARGAGGYQTLTEAAGFKPLIPTVYYDVSTAYPYLESGQAAFVYNNSILPVTLTFNESDKTSGSHLVFRGQDVSSSQFFRTYLSTSSGKIADGNAVAFNKNYQNRLDANDAVKFSNTGENFGLRLDGIILAIEARSPVQAGDTLFYDMRNVAQAVYQLRFSPESMQTAPVVAFLVDNYLKSKTEISLAENSTANFTVNSDAASYAVDRFMVVFEQAAVLPVTFVSIKATEKDKNILVAWQVANENNMQQYEVEKSTDGNQFEKVATTAAKNSGSGNYQWTDENATSGYNYYRVKSVGKDNNSLYSTVVKLLVDDLKSTINIFPNPITDGIVHLQFKNQPQGKYRIRLVNSLGALILAKDIQFTGGNGSEDIKWDYKMARGIYQLEITKPDGSAAVIKVKY